MSEVSSEVKSMENEGTSLKMDRNIYYRRGTNPWPSTTTHTGGAFGSTGSSSQEQPRKFGGGFGSSTFDGFGSCGRGGGERFSNFGDELNFLGIPRKETGFGSVRSSGFGYTGNSSSRLVSSDPLNMNKDRCVTPSPSENILIGNGSRRGAYANSPRSEGMTPPKRPRSGRRTGRRGRPGATHCYHCQEHGHISRACPKKTAETDEFEGGGGVEGNRFIDDEILSGQQRTDSLVGLGGSYQNAKLENQKARESYYGGYGYGNSSVSNSIKGAATGSGRSGGAMSSTSPEVDKFSEQLDHALKLTNVEPTTPSPRVMTTMAKGPGTKSSSIKEDAAPIKQNSLPIRDGFKETVSEMLTIETRRTVMREGEYHFEETTVINFPRVLPPNVRVITAQFVPIASQGS